jgi:hypothetical protein
MKSLLSVMLVLACGLYLTDWKSALAAEVAYPIDTTYKGAVFNSEIGVK